MMDPSSLTKDYLNEIETRLPAGRFVARVALALSVLALCALCLGVLWSSGRAAWSLLPTSLPVDVSPRDWISLTVLVVLFAGGSLFIGRRIRRLELAASAATSTTAAELQQQLQRVDERLVYVERKVGDELQDLLAGQLFEEALRAQGMDPADVRRVVGEHVAPPPLTPPQAMRVAQMQAVLREAAAAGREAAVGDLDLDGAAERAGLHLMMTSLISDCFSYQVVADYDAFNHAREAKANLRGQRPDGRRHFVEFAEYFESLANRLRLDDIDLTADLPGSFRQFRTR